MEFTCQQGKNYTMVLPRGKFFEFTPALYTSPTGYKYELTFLKGDFKLLVSLFETDLYYTSNGHPYLRYGIKTIAQYPNAIIFYGERCNRIQVRLANLQS